MNLNSCTLSGRLTKDADLSTTTKGTSMSKFRIAVNDRRNDDTLFVNVLCFGKAAENLQPMLTRGRLVGVQGKLQIRDYQDNEGQNRTSVAIMADNIELGPPRNGSSPQNAEAELAKEAPF